MAHIEKHSEAAALKMIDTLQYQASDPEYSDDVLYAYTFVVTRAIEDELLRQYNKGILPPASRGARRGCFRLYAERAGNIVTADLLCGA